jgi:hypothetical protein
MVAAGARGERRQGRRERRRERRASRKKTQTGARLVLVTRREHTKEIVPQIVPRQYRKPPQKTPFFSEVSGTILVLFVVLEIVPEGTSFVTI